MHVNVGVLAYNNYFNRLVKKESSLSGYTPFLTTPIITGVNFNPADGVSTTLVVNAACDGSDYLIVCAPDQTILSRWFIMEATRLRTGQYQLALRRDVVADYLDQIKNSVAFVEKGYVSRMNPLIFNREGQPFNQIKKAEIPLYDATQAGWVVAYLANTVNGTVDIGIDIDPLTIPELSSFPFADLDGETITGPVNEAESYWTTVVDIKNPKTKNMWAIDRSFTGDDLCKYIIYENTASAFITTQEHYVSGDNIASRFFNYDVNIDPTVFYNSLLTHRFTQARIDELTSYQGKLFKQTTGTDVKFYRVNLNTATEKEYKVKYSAGEPYVSIKNYYQAFIGVLPIYFCIEVGWNPGSSRYVPVVIKATTIQLQLEEVVFNTNELKLDIGTTNTKPRQMSDAPYVMCTFPFGANFNVRTGDTVTQFPRFSKTEAIEIAASISKSLQPASSGGFVYDVQLLPYCPIKDMLLIVEGADDLDLQIKSQYREHLDFEYITTKTDPAEQRGVVAFAGVSSFKFSIPYQLETSSPSDSIEYKVEQQSTKYRLASPNYANFFEFDPWMNNTISAFNVCCTYKPYSPFIKISPRFGGLYGRDFNDDRGLICGGDYSLPQISNQWESYQIQNKNYAAIFERGTEHLETDYRLQREQHMAGMGYQMARGLLGVVESVVGAEKPSEAIGPASFGVGGMLLSQAQSATSLRIARHKFAEALDFRQDTWMLNLQNIQARPSGLVQTSTFNANYKIVPFIEKYQPTSVEKVNFKNKLKYGGMSLAAIGTINEYLQPTADWTFIKARIIRIDIKEDTHIAMEIAGEISTGVFMKGGGN